MANFYGTDFDERGAGGGRDFQAHGSKEEIVVLLVPGSYPIIQQIGGGASEFSLSGQCDESRLDDLRSAVGVTGTLSYVGGETTATLRELTDVVKVKDDLDIWRFTLSFITV
jgi:hypothetical protein